jgi:hypothetical protein
MMNPLFPRLILGFALISLAQPALAIRFLPPPLPPDRSAPGNRGEGASRGCAIGDRPLTALAPAYSENPDLTQVWGLTSQEKPSFWFYVPYEASVIQSMEFVLQDDRETTLYRTEIPVANAEFVQVKLPETLSPLVIGKAYRWFFKVKTVCTPQQPATLSYVEGWVQRQALPNGVRDRLQTATPQQQAAIYAENGIWYDALNVLAELRTANSTDAAQEWQTLLDAIGLSDLATRP